MTAVITESKAHHASPDTATHHPREPRGLSDLVPGYPEDHPQTLKALWEADPDQIHHQVAWELRRMTFEAVRSTGAKRVHSPIEAFTLLKNGYALRPLEGAWTSVGLSETREVIRVPHHRGGVATLRVYTPLIPKVDDLPVLPRTPGRRSGKTAAWLVIYGGTPEVLSKPGVAKGLATLRRRLPREKRAGVADILFFHKDLEAGVPPTLWSVMAGCGMQENGSPEGVRLEFPDPEALETVRKGASHE